jgi:glycosyltransferase involved in cell wall biosynthesis
MRIVILTTDNREPHKDHDNPVPHFGTAPSALLQGLALLPDIEVHVISCIRRPVQSPAKIAPNTFFHSLVVPKTGWMTTLFQGCVRASRKKIHEIQPDIVHGQGTEADCSLSAIYSGFPNVLTLHGNLRLISALNRDRPFSYMWLAARLEGFVLPRTRGVVCITHYTREAVKDLAPRTWVLPNAVDKSFFDVHAAPDPSAPPIGLCVGAVCFRKNQNALIRALDPLAKEKKFKIIFASEPPRGAYGLEFLQLVRERPWCEYTGFLNQEQLKARLATASFMVLPTLEDNCPMTVLEGMAAGVPVLASKVGGVPDLIDSGKTGLFCDPDRPESFREGVEKILANRQWIQQLAASAKAVALQRFHPQVIARQHIEIYRQVLGRPELPSMAGKTHW